jgi:hypothetical protein
MQSDVIIARTIASAGSAMSAPVRVITLILVMVIVATRALVVSIIMLCIYPPVDVSVRASRPKIQIFEIAFTAEIRR